MLPNLSSLRTKILENKYKVKANKDLLDSTRAELLGLTGQVRDLEIAAEVLKRIGEQKKQATIEMFERVVTFALREVFGFTYQFSIEVSSQGRVATKFKLMDGEVERDIMTSFGGGVIDVVAFVLKALMLASTRPRRAKVMYMDETFKHVSPEYVPNVAKLLQSLTQQLEMQFVLVSHKAEFLEVADNAYLLEKTNDGTKAKPYS
jgi:DNA repair exonuclease SbcCD ATPase subunit